MMQSQEGNSVLEFVLYLPIALLLLFGSTDIGLRWFEQSSVVSIVQSASRVAVHAVHKQQGNYKAQSSAVLDFYVVTDAIHAHAQARLEALYESSVGASSAVCGTAAYSTLRRR